MKVKTFYGNIHEINPCQLYIKPFYNGKNIIYYAVCSNVGNTEVELCKYGDVDEYKGISCVKDMIQILFLHKDDIEPFEMLKQQEVIQWHKGMNKLLKAIKTSK